MSVTNKHSLIEVDDSILIVIDVQDAFLLKLPESDRSPFVRRISWLACVASKLSVPVVVTAEDIPNIGGTVTPIANSLPKGTKTFNKKTFGLAADSAIMAELNSTSRRTAILTGLETDVCVAQSAIGLLDAGYRVAVASDAVASPGLGQEYGLGRMRDAGAIVSSVKGIYYEWIRTLERANDFRARYSKELGTPGTDIWSE